LYPIEIRDLVSYQVSEVMNDMDTDRALRPQTFSDFIGQSENKSNLEVYVKAARSRGEPLDHLLLSGPPGLGKTCLANILAREMHSELKVVNAPTLKTKAELVGLLINLNKNDILFLDEIHSLNSRIEEILYPAMEDYKLEVIAGSGPSATAVSFDLSAFTLIGATTRVGLLSKPLQDRFGDTIQMELYTPEELAVIVLANSDKLGFVCESDAAIELARRSRGTPRVANKLLRRVRDFAQASGNAKIDASLVCAVCEKLGVDSFGLDKTARKILQILIEKNGPVGLSTLSAMIGESKDSIEDVYEPVLLQTGFIEKTLHGRIATDKARNHLLSN